MMLNLITPHWPAPYNVHARMTTRHGGMSKGSYASLNLGLHVGDDPDIVAQNRQRLAPYLPTEPRWLTQVHGTNVVLAETVIQALEADASYTREPNIVCAIMTADCLPVFLCDMQGTSVALAHAGWRGLLTGVIENTIATLDVPPHTILAYLGAAIGPTAFEVGSEVRAAFLAHSAIAESAFTPRPNGKWLADIYQLARQRLYALGVQHVFGGEYCTFSDAERFFSYRREGVTGRLASLIWRTV